MVPDLPVQVEVALRDEHLVLAPRRPGAAAAVGRRDVARAVERPHVPVGLLPVPRGERVGEDLRADAVDLGREHRVRDRGVAPLDRPEGLGEGPDCRDGVEDDLGAVQGEGLPVERVVAAVADVDGDPGEAEVEDPGKKRFLKKKKRFSKFLKFFISWVFSLFFSFPFLSPPPLQKNKTHTPVPMLVAPGLVEGRLVKVPDPRDVHLALLAQDDRGRVVDAVDHHRGVPDSVELRRVALQDAVDDDEAVPGGELEAELGGSAPFGGLLRELAPPLFSRAKGKGHGPALLGAQDLALGRRRDLRRLRDAVVEGPELLGEGSVGGGDDRVLSKGEPNESGRAQLLGLGAEAPRAQPEARRGGRRCGLRLRREGEGLDGGSAVEAEEDALGLGEGLGGEVVWSEKVGEGGRRRERERRMMRDEVEET